MFLVVTGSGPSVCPAARRGRRASARCCRTAAVAAPHRSSKVPATTSWRFVVGRADAGTRSRNLLFARQANSRLPSAGVCHPRSSGPERRRLANAPSCWRLPRPSWRRWPAAVDPARLAGPAKIGDQGRSGCWTASRRPKTPPSTSRHHLWLPHSDITVACPDRDTDPEARHPTLTQRRAFELTGSGGPHSHVARPAGTQNSWSPCWGRGTSHLKPLWLRASGSRRFRRW